MPISDENRRRCSDNALKCFGTAYIFEKRAASLRSKMKVLAFLGIAVPAALGAVAGTIGAGSTYLPLAITVASILGGIQLICSIWSLVARWDDDFAYCLESKSANYRLADDFIHLAQTTDLSVKEFEIELKGVETEADSRSQQDQRHDISDKEKRMGMRAGLRKYQRPCATCKTVPTSLKPTACETCGAF